MGQNLRHVNSKVVLPINLLASTWNAEDYNGSTGYVLSLGGLSETFDNGTEKSIAGGDLCECVGEDLCVVSSSNEASGKRVADSGVV